MTLDIDGHIDFVTNEFRRKFRTVIDQITLPVSQRVDQYTCWPGLTVMSGTRSSKNLQLSFKRNPSKLRVGDYIYVNDLGVDPKDVISGPRGIIQSIDEENSVVEIGPGFQQSGRFNQRFRTDDRIVLDQTLPGEHNSRELPLLALRMLDGHHGQHPRLDRIRGLLSGEGSAEATGDDPLERDGDPSLQELTDAQFEAVQTAIEQDFVVIQGPPGTGKTHVLGLVIRELVRRGKKVGVCALTHEAINNVLEECLGHEEIGEVCKLGSRNAWRGRDTHDRLSLMERPAAFFRRKTTPPVVGFTQYAAFNPVARGLSDGLEEALFDRFDVLVFDEAGQLTLPASVMAMVHTNRFVFAGDHKQLPPVVSTVRPGEGFGISIFQHLVDVAGHTPVLLDQTFRLNDELVAFPSGEFYQDRLQSATVSATRRLEFTGEPDNPEIFDPQTPSTLALVDHKGRGQESPEEAALVASLVDDAIRHGIPPEEMAVVAPHRRQNVKITEFLARMGHTGTHPIVDTVERIQGQERDLIILSMTLSDPDILSYESDFLFLPNRFNVAITRARKKLIVVASPHFFRAHPSRSALARDSAAALRRINVLKKWYFRHRPYAVDATAESARVLADLATRRTDSREAEAGGDPADMSEN